MKRVAVAVVLLGVAGWLIYLWLQPPTIIKTSGCFEDLFEPRPPTWAKVSPEQMLEAKKHGVPVAFENDLGMRFVLIPAGTFTMGAPEDEFGRTSVEAQREVNISNPLYVQVTEVTNQQFRRFRPDHRSGECKGHSLDGSKQPVASVSFDAAAEFAGWLSRREPARAYRLPAEEEWEYACRAGTTTLYYWGDVVRDIPRFANCYDEVAMKALGWPRNCSPLDDGHIVSAPVATFGPNAWGIHDMSGNVAEWTVSFYDRRDAAKPESDLTRAFPLMRRMRAVRGGSWLRDLKRIRSASRRGTGPVLDFHDYGFRLVSPLPEK